MNDRVTTRINASNFLSFDEPSNLNNNRTIHKECTETETIHNIRNRTIHKIIPSSLLVAVKIAGKPWTVLVAVL